MQEGMDLGENGLTPGKERVATERDVPDGHLASAHRGGACYARWACEGLGIVPCFVRSSMASRMPWTISSKASSCEGHLVTALPSVGRSLSLPKGAPCQSVGRRIMGRTRA